MNQKEIFEKAYVDWSDDIFRYVYFRVFDRDIARDITQETFYKVWDYLAKGKSIDNVRAFLYRTAHNLLVNSIRDKKPTVSLEELQETIGFEIADTQQEESKTRLEDVATLFESFTIFKAKDAELMRLRYIDGISIKDIAQILSTSENTISVKIHRLLEKLKQHHLKT